jgi:hypothetical protein
MAGFGFASAGYYLAIAGAASDNSSLQAAGLIALGVGIAALIFSAVAIDPSADTRAWTTLPGQIYIAVGRAEPGSRLRLAVEAPGDRSQAWTDVPVLDRLNVYWIRLLPGRAGGTWPGAAGLDPPTNPEQGGAP